MVDLFGLFTKPQFLFSRQERGTFYDSFVTLHADTPELVALFTKLLSREDFQKTTLFWEFENLNGTNNHVERTGRAFRKRQKSHYRLRVGTSLRAMLNHLLARQSSRPVGRTGDRGIEAACELAEFESTCPKAVSRNFVPTGRDANVTSIQHKDTPLGIFGLCPLAIVTLRGEIALSLDEGRNGLTEHRLYPVSSRSYASCDCQRSRCRKDSRTAIKKREHATSRKGEVQLLSNSLD